MSVPRKVPMSTPGKDARSLRRPLHETYRFQYWSCPICTAPMVRELSASIATGAAAAFRCPRDQSRVFVTLYDGRLI